MYHLGLDRWCADLAMVVLGAAAPSEDRSFAIEVRNHGDRAEMIVADMFPGRHAAPVDPVDGRVPMGGTLTVAVPAILQNAWPYVAHFVYSDGPDDGYIGSNFYFPAQAAVDLVNPSRADSRRPLSAPDPDKDQRRVRLHAGTDRVVLGRCEVLRAGVKRSRPDPVRARRWTVPERLPLWFRGTRWPSKLHVPQGVPERQ